MPFARLARSPARNKFNAKRAPGPWGRMYDSLAERDFALELAALETAREISDVQTQPRIELEPGIFFKPDFSWLERGRRVYCDVKGVTTARFHLICKLWRLHGPGPLRIVKRARQRNRFVTVREILPKGVA